MTAIGIRCFTNTVARRGIIFLTPPLPVIRIGADAGCISGAAVIGAGISFNLGIVAGGERILRGVTVTAVFAAAGLRTQFARAFTIGRAVNISCFTTTIKKFVIIRARLVKQT